MTKHPKITVIICVHNALEDVKNCVNSVLKTKYPKDKFDIVIVDDGSEKETADYVVSVGSKHKNLVTTVRRPKAGGYTVAANTGLRAKKSDIYALLNSDTIVPKLWLEKMTKVFLDNPDVGLVGPLSNAASWQSVPERSNPKGGWAINELPLGIDVDAMDQIVEKSVSKNIICPRVPLLNGFCYMVKSDVIDKIGYLDEQGFPRGFGEEDDFSLRSANAGFGLMIAINTYVFHAKSKSYGGTQRNTLSKKGQTVLKKKHSEVRLKRSTEMMKINPYLEKMRLNITETLSKITR